MNQNICHEGFCRFYFDNNINQELYDLEKTFHNQYILVAYKSNTVRQLY